MKLGFFEQSYVNGFIRATLHQPRVMRWFQAQVPLEKGAEVLEIGCGRGVGLRLLAKHVAPYAIYAIDFDPRQVQRAQENARTTAPLPQVTQGDAARLVYQNRSFHGVFSFGAVHHVPDWEQALQEIHRVLRDGGYVYLEEFYRGFLHHPLVRWLAPHPSGRFNHKELLEALTQQGFEVKSQRQIIPGCYGLMIAQKVAEAATVPSKRA